MRCLKKDVPPKTEGDRLRFLGATKCRERVVRGSRFARYKKSSCHDNGQKDFQTVIESKTRHQKQMSGRSYNTSVLHRISSPSLVGKIGDFQARQFSWLWFFAIQAFPRHRLSGIIRNRSPIQWRDRVGLEPTSLLSPCRAPCSLNMNFMCLG